MSSAKRPAPPHSCRHCRPVDWSGRLPEPIFGGICCTFLSPAELAVVWRVCKQWQPPTTNRRRERLLGEQKYLGKLTERGWKPYSWTDNELPRKGDVLSLVFSRQDKEDKEDKEEEEEEYLCTDVFWNAEILGALWGCGGQVLTWIVPSRWMRAEATVTRVYEGSDTDSDSDTDSSFSERPKKPVEKITRMDLSIRIFGFEAVQRSLELRMHQAWEDDGTPKQMWTSASPGLIGRLVEEKKHAVREARAAEERNLVATVLEAQKQLRKFKERRCPPDRCPGCRRKLKGSTWHKSCEIACHLI